MWAKVASPQLSRDSIDSEDDGAYDTNKNMTKRKFSHPVMDAKSRIFILLCASLIPFGAHYMKHSLGPIKVYFVGTDGGGEGVFTHSQFGAFLAATSWPNIVFPFLTGMLVDEKGHEFSSILFTSVALIGHIIFATFLMPNLVSFPFALLGRVIYGFGEGGTGIVQGAIVGTWFEGDTLAFSIGFTESIHYLANWVGKALPAELAQIEGGFRGAVWLGTVSLFISVLVAIIYYMYSKTGKPFRFALGKHDTEERQRLFSQDRRSESGSDSQLTGGMTSPQLQPRSRAASGVSYYGAMLLPGVDEEEADEAQDDTERHHVHHQKEERHAHYYLQLHISRVQLLPLSFWIVGLMHMVFSNLHNLFGGISADFIRAATQMTPVQAGFVASLDSLLPVFLAPLVGIFVDTYGGRLWICMVASITSVMAFAVFTNDSVTPEWAVFAMILLSVGTSTTPTLVKSAVPVIVPTESLGTAFGIYSVFESLGGGVGHVLFGYIRDISSSYADDLRALMCLALFSFLLNAAALVRAPELNAASFRK